MLRSKACMRKKELEVVTRVNIVSLKKERKHIITKR